MPQDSFFECSLQLQSLMLVPGFKGRIIGSGLPVVFKSMWRRTPRYVSQPKSARWSEWEGFVVGGESGEGALAIGTIARDSTSGSGSPGQRTGSCEQLVLSVELLSNHNK